MTGSSPEIDRTLPGTARHMVLSPLDKPRRPPGLAERNAAVVGRNHAVPMRRHPGGAQPRDHRLAENRVLEAAAREDDVRHADPASDIDDSYGEAGVEPRRDVAGANA